MKSSLIAGTIAVVLLSIGTDIADSGELPKALDVEVKNFPPSPNETIFQANQLWTINGKKVKIERVVGNWALLGGEDTQGGWRYMPNFVGSGYAQIH